MEETTIATLKRLLAHVESLFDDEDVDPETMLKDAVLGAFDFEIAELEKRRDPVSEEAWIKSHEEQGE